MPLPRFYCLSGCAICFFLCCRVCLLDMLCYDVLFELFHVVVDIFAHFVWLFLFILFGLNQFEFTGFGGFCVTTYILSSTFLL